MEPIKVVKFSFSSTAEYVEGRRKIQKEYDEEYVLIFTSISLGETLAVGISKKDNPRCKFCNLLTISKATARAVSTELDKNRRYHKPCFFERNIIVIADNNGFCSESCKKEYRELYGRY